MDKNRVEAFSDGVLAIAITLLIIEVRIPEAEEGGLWDEFVDAWPQLAAYFVSFFIIGIIWVNHHALFLQVKKVDRPLLFFNLLLLLFVVVIPFSTAVLADYIRDSDNSHIAAAIYSGTMLLVALAYQATWRWILRDDRLLHEPVDARIVRAAKIRFGAGVVVYLGTIALSFVSALATLIVHFLIALYYMFDQLVVGKPAVSRGSESADRGDL
jgi:uncharacterized membrane protein